MTGKPECRRARESPLRSSRHSEKEAWGIVECALMRRFYILLAVCAALLFVARPGVPQNPERFKVRLTTVPMDGGMRNTVAGSGSASATLSGAKLSIAGTFDGLKS